MADEAPTAWHSMAGSQALDTLNTGPAGLSGQEAADRLSRHGPNALPSVKRVHPLMRFMAQFNNALIYFLLAAAAAAALLKDYVDAAVILLVVMVNAVVGVIQEGKAERALGAIRDMIAPHATVVRDGGRRVVAVRELVPGDIVVLEAGDRVPADIRLLRTRGLLIDEAALTGESVAAEKHENAVDANAVLGDQASMAFSGTLVASGQANGVVVHTGLNTQIGRISGLLQTVEATATPLLRQIDSFAKRFTWFVLAGATALFAFSVLAREFHWIDALVAVVALSVGIIPEGLPAVITITLAIGVQRMAARNAVIRRLPAVETLGATSVICSDKTGTLTRNEMTVRHLLLEKAEIAVSGTGYEPEGNLTIDGNASNDADAISYAVPIIRCGLLCNDARLKKDGDRWRVDGDPMEGALVALAMKSGINPDHEREEWQRVDEIPFDAAHRFMATLHRRSNGTSAIFVKGAPEAILRMTEIETGEVARLWHERAAAAASRGERLLGFATKAVSGNPKRIGTSDLNHGLKFLGLIGFIDPPRDEARAAIAECRSAGIAVKMITGDHAGTALAIANQLGIAETPVAITGSDVEALNDAELAKRVLSVDVFARTSPEHKLRIVRALQSHDLIVAMTGDGVNDAPSLKQADVGTAMGLKGTEAAKESAAMVLLDDNFASIVAAVREGRTVYDNIRKVIAWTLPTNGGESLAVILAILLGFTLPMTATQILWINLVSAVTLGLVLAFEPTEPGTMNRPPRDAAVPLLTPFLLWRIALVSILFAGVSLAVFFYVLDQGKSLEHARTMVVNMLMIAETFYLFNVRHLHSGSVTWRGILGTPAVLIALGALVLAQLLFTYAPFMNQLFHSRPLSVMEGFSLIGIGVLLLAFLEVEKALMPKLGWFKELT